jgi:hypothetical protein
MLGNCGLAPWQPWQRWSRICFTSANVAGAPPARGNRDCPAMPRIMAPITDTAAADHSRQSGLRQYAGPPRIKDISNSYLILLFSPTGTSSQGRRRKHDFFLQRFMTAIEGARLSATKPDALEAEAPTRIMRKSTGRG